MSTRAKCQHCNLTHTHCERPNRFWIYDPDQAQADDAEPWCGEDAFVAAEAWAEWYDAACQSWPDERIVLGFYSELMGRGLVPEPQCLALTKDGHPKHPLYCRYDAPLVRFPIPSLVEG